MLRANAPFIAPVLEQRLGTLVAGLAVFVLLSLSGPALADEYESGELQLELAPGVLISTINARYGTATLDSLPPLYLLQCPEGGEDEFQERLRMDPGILEAEYSYENETPEGTRQMVVAAVGGTIEDYLDQNLVARLHLADIQSHARGDGILVAVLDTGVLADHPALNGVVAPGGWDFADSDSDPTDSVNGVDDDLDGVTDEGAGHGTMVAGILHLVAPNAAILPVRVLNDEGQGRTFAVAKGIRFAVEHGARVINLSLGLPRESIVLRYEVHAAWDAGVVLVSAAGNGGVEGSILYPARDSHVLCVAALDSSDVKADFSNWSSRVALSAPGLGVRSSYYDGGYAIGAGTSFSAPFIAGQCALIRGLNPNLTLEEIYQLAGAGFADIYSIPGNEPYLEKLGTGRFDGLQTWLVQPGTSGIPGPGPARAGGGLGVFPNPAFVGMSVSFRPDGITAAAGLSAAVQDVQGRVIRTLSAAPNALSLRWDGLDASGRLAPAGVYFVRLTGLGPGRAAAGRLVLLR